MELVATPEILARGQLLVQVVQVVTMAITTLEHQEELNTILIMLVGVVIMEVEVLAVVPMVGGVITDLKGL
jgi:hypothetical protein